MHISSWKETPLVPTSAPTGTAIDVSTFLEQFQIKVSNFCQRITVPKAPTAIPESPIAKIKARRSSTSIDLIKPIFSQEEV